MHEIKLFDQTRSCAALLRAGDLDWIVGPSHSWSGYILGCSQFLLNETKLSPMEVPPRSLMRQNCHPQGTINCKSPAVYSDSPHCLPFQPLLQYFFAIFSHIYSQLSFLHMKHRGSSNPNILFSFTNLFDLSWRTKADKRQWITRIIFQQFYHR